MVPLREVQRRFVYAFWGWGVKAPDLGGEGEEGALEDEVAFEQAAAGVGEGFDGVFGEGL